MIYKTSQFSDNALSVECQHEDMGILDLFEEVLKSVFFSNGNVLFVYKNKCDWKFLDSVQNHILLLDQLLEYGLKFTGFSAKSVEVSLYKEKEIEINFLLNQDLNETEILDLVSFRNKVQRAGVDFLYSKLRSRICLRGAKKLNSSVDWRSPSQYVENRAREI